MRSCFGVGEGSLCACWVVVVVVWQAREVSCHVIARVAIPGWVLVLQRGKKAWMAARGNSGDRVFLRYRARCTCVSCCPRHERQARFFPREEAPEPPKAGSRMQASSFGRHSEITCEVYHTDV